MSDPKRSKMLRRTLVGGGLTVALALVLWAASAFDSAYPILAVTYLLVGCCVVEVDRMGSFGGRRWIWPLAAGALVSLAHSLASLDGLDVAARDPGLGVLWLGGASVLALGAVTATYAIVCSDSWPVRIAGVAALASAAAPQFSWTAFVSIVALCFIALRLVRFGASRPAHAAALIVLGALLVVSIPALTWVWVGMGFEALVALVAIAKLGDAAAYYVGNAIGRRRPFPNVSPGKTTEGFVGSLLAACLAGALATQLGWLPSQPWGWAGGLLAGAAVNVPAQLSDLLESWVKRKAGVKDSGAWFGPSGGMLDLVDSFFLAAPLALVVWPMLMRFEHA